MADIITQAELKSVLETYNALGQRILGYRRRIRAGAFIEPGEYQAYDSEENPIDMGPTTCMGMYHLDIAPAGRRSELYAAPAVQQPEPEAAKPALPEWLTKTPHECQYFLAMEEGGMDCQECQTIDLTRKEFLLIKLFVAKLRLVSVPLEQPDWLKVGGTEESLWDELETEQIAAVPEVTHA